MTEVSKEQIAAKSHSKYLELQSHHEKLQKVLAEVHAETVFESIEMMQADIDKAEAEKKEAEAEKKVAEADLAAVRDVALDAVRVMASEGQMDRLDRAIDQMDQLQR